MKYIFLFLISILLQYISTKENNTTTSTEYIKKEVKPTGEIKIENENENEEEGYYSSSKIHELNDITFDYIIRDGKIYRWFIIFYSRSCGHCKRAKKEISKIFETYNNISNLRFAQIEAYQNTVTNIRFNISGVPYMILVENGSMYEMDLFPNYENLKDFIFTNFTEVEGDLKPIPRKVKFAYVAWVILKQTLDDVTNNFNIFLSNKGIKFQFNTYGFIGCILGLIILCCWGMIHCCLRCCCNDDDLMAELQRLDEELNKRKENQENNTQQQEEEEDGEEYEYEYEEEEEDDVEEVEKVGEITEEEKKRQIEEQKEKEQKEEKEKEEKEEKEDEDKTSKKKKKE
jgi:chemotaxis protein histidine kinase CheA